MNFWSVLLEQRNPRSNCTFMELKFPCVYEECPGQLVLIVPLWNWNAFLSAGNARKYSSNCTFMELKYWLMLLHFIPALCSNCTFMELKSASSSRCPATIAKVLIVPLWNWNQHCSLSLPIKIEVLIVPLWNWNLHEAASNQGKRAF